MNISVFVKWLKSLDFFSDQIIAFLIHLSGGIKEFVNHGEGLCVSELTNGNTSSSSSTSSTVINDGEEPPSPTTDSEHMLRVGSGVCPSEGIPMTQILPHLYVGNEVDAANLDELRLHGISYVLNVTNAVPCFHEGESAMRYKRIPVRDNGLINLHMHFQAAFEFIGEFDCMILISISIAVDSLQQKWNDRKKGRHLKSSGKYSQNFHKKRY